MQRVKSKCVSQIYPNYERFTNGACDKKMKYEGGTQIFHLHVQSRCSNGVGLKSPKILI